MRLGNQYSAIGIDFLNYLYMFLKRLKSVLCKHNNTFSHFKYVKSGIILLRTKNIKQVFVQLLAP